MVRRGELYWAGPGSTPLRKRRPVLVVQNDAGNRHAPHVIVAAVRHESGKGLPVHVPLARGTGGLSKDSVVDCGMLATLPKPLLGRKLGALGPGPMRRVDAALKVALALGG